MIGKALLSGANVYILASPSAHVFRQTFRTGRVKVRDQPLGDLGRRMGISASAAPGCSVIIGSDIPSLSLPILVASCNAVRRFDAVFGPATDGGYYLVGIRSPSHAFRLYDRVRWSGPHALADTLKNVPRHWKVALLPTLSDVDCAADLNLNDQPPANAFVMMISSPSRIVREAKSTGRTALES